MKKYLWGVLFVASTILRVQGQTSADTYVDSVFRSLSEEERITQLMIVTAYAQGDALHEKELSEIIQHFKVGGLIFFQGSPTRQVELTNYYQRISKTPLLIFMDAEWGVGMRLDSAVDLPYQIMLGATQNGKLVYDYGSIVATQCKRLGVHINLAPVLDINNNPLNPVIGYRSFGQNLYKVSAYGVEYIKALQENGLYASAKHFPGHGDVDADSHEELPILPKTRSELEALEFVPFYKAIQDANVQTILVAHLNLPLLGQKKRTPSSTSPEVINDILIRQMEFKGLVITDALNMKGLKKFVEDDEVGLRTLKAGNDLLCMPDNIQFTIQSVKQEMLRDDSFRQRVYQKVRKVLYAKYALGLQHYTPLSTERVTEDLNNWTKTNFLERVAQDAITLVRLSDKNLLTKKYAKVVYIAVGENTPNRLSYLLKQSYPVDIINLQQDNSKNDVKEIFNTYKRNTDRILFIVGIHQYSNSIKRGFDISPETDFLLKKISSVQNSMVVFFGNPYIIANYPSLPNILLAYQNGFETQSYVGNIFLQKAFARGVLPVSINDSLSHTSGVFSFDLLFSKAKISEQTKSKLDKIDELVTQSIEERVFPGCQILAIHQNQIIYQKNFGKYTYEGIEKVQHSSIYDLASLTKVFATTLALMKLYEKKQIKLNDPIAKYVPLLRNTSKANLTIKDLLAHQSGLVSWIPFYKETLDANGNPLPNIYHHSYEEPYTIRIAKNLYMHKAWKDSLLYTFIRSPIQAPKKYVYSDLGFVLLYMAVENIVGTSIESYLQKEFYTPLGLSNTYINPNGARIQEDLVPTEFEQTFRKQLIRGYVHDYTAAMMGGFGGNAGLFSNAADLSVLCYMLLHKGKVGRINFLHESTIKLFTSYVNSSISRRGLGFDKPKPGGGETPSIYASARTFGHTGFTGTCVWVDPDKDLIFVFLSNRVHPSSDNKKIQTEKTREKILDLVYESIAE